ncbi:MAG: tyrosine-type recombinase/integrase [Actinobacteria bacterium]|nr:tyrosine-type recombinase/integrase [Actinomycetota bacterium]
MKDMLNHFKIELKNRNYAFKTIKMYLKAVDKFLLFASGNKYTPEERIPYFLEAFSESPEQKRIAFCAVNAFYQYVIGKPCPYILNKSKRRKTERVILTNNEIHEILDQIKNRKHYLLIALQYSSGLRVSEVINLKIKYLDFSHKGILIRDSKHHRDRNTLMPEKLVQDLKAMIKNRLAKEYLFLTQSGKKYSVRTVQAIFKRALLKTSITKSVSCHTLRHSFATHLIESGVNIRSIQQLLGHKSVKTTMIYTHLADPVTQKIKSPF